MGSKTLLVTVSDDRFGRKDGQYATTQRKIQKIFENNPDFGINHFLMMTWDDIVQTPFYEANQVLLDNKDASKNGRAYKPYAISRGLSSLQDGDFLVYTDCSPEIWKMGEDFKIPTNYELQILQDLCESNANFLTAFVKWDTRPLKENDLGIHTHENFTLDLCMETMGLRQFYKSFMPASGMIVIEKNARTEALVDEWLKWCCDDRCSTLGKKEDPNDWSYWDKEQWLKLGCRHDQSILGLLLCQHGCSLVVPDLHPAGIPNHNPLRYCRTDLTYQFMDPNNNPDKERRIRKGDKVVNSAGTELTVFEIRYKTEAEYYLVGLHPESMYMTTADKLTLVE